MCARGRAGAGGGRRGARCAPHTRTLSRSRPVVGCVGKTKNKKTRLHHFLFFHGTRPARARRSQGPTLLTQATRMASPALLRSAAARWLTGAAASAAASAAPATAGLGPSSLAAAAAAAASPFATARSLWTASSCVSVRGLMRGEGETGTRPSTARTTTTPLHAGAGAGAPPCFALLHQRRWMAVPKRKVREKAERERERERRNGWGIERGVWGCAGGFGEACPRLALVSIGWRWPTTRWGHPTHPVHPSLRRSPPPAGASATGPSCPAGSPPSPAAPPAPASCPCGRPPRRPGARRRSARGGWGRLGGGGGGARRPRPPPPSRNERERVDRGGRSGSAVCVCVCVCETCFFCLHHRPRPPPRPLPAGRPPPPRPLPAAAVPPTAAAPPPPPLDGRRPLKPGRSQAGA